MTDGLSEQVHEEQGIPYFPVGTPRHPVLIVKIRYVAGIPLRAENGSWMLGTAFPPGRPSQANRCHDGEQHRMMTEREKEHSRCPVAQRLQNLEGPHHSFSLFY